MRPDADGRDAQSPINPGPINPGQGSTARDGAHLLAEEAAFDRERIETGLAGTRALRGPQRGRSFHRVGAAATQSLVGVDR